MPIKNQPLTITYWAWNTSTNSGQTGDQANHTIKLLQDGTEASPTNSPAQVDSTNGPGIYSLALTAGDMNYNCVAPFGKSSTANVVLIFPPCLVTERGFLNTGAAPNAAGGLLTFGTGAGQINVDGAGNVDANLLKWNGTAVSSPATAGVPDVNVKNYNNQTAATDGNNYPKVDVVDIAGSAVNTAAAQLGVNVVNVAGTASAGTAGYVGIDWSAIHAPTTSVNLSGTTIETVSGTVGSISGITFPTHFNLLGIDSSGDVTFNNVSIATVGSVTGNVDGSVATVTGAVGSVTGNVGGSIGGSVASVTNPVTVNLTQNLTTPRALDSIGDTSLTLNDAFHCAIAVYAGKWAISGTTWTCETPSGDVALRTFTLDSSSAPTQRS
jgi:hypothetical protein